MIYFFVAKNLTEIDHFLPLMHSLDSEKKTVILSLININIKNHDIKKKFSDKLIRNIKIINFFNNNNFFINFILENCISISELLKNKSYNPINYVLAVLRYFLFGNPKLIKLFLTKNKLLTYFSKINPEAIFIDNNFEITGYYDCINFISKKLKIKLFELPHSLTLSKRPIVKKNKDKNNFLVFNSEYEINQYVDNELNYNIIKSGSFKYDKTWQDLLFENFHKKKQKKLILYIMTDHGDKNITAEFDFLYYMVTQEYYDFMVCPPSRDYYNFFKKHKNYKLFESKINFNDSLIKVSQQADYFFTTISGGVVDGIVRLKPIFFLKFLQNSKHKRSLIFDEFDCFFKFENFIALKASIDKNKLSEKLNISQKKKYIKFLKKYIYFDNPRNEIINKFKNYVTKK